MRHSATNMTVNCFPVANIVLTSLSLRSSRRFAARMAEMGVTFETAFDETAILSDVVDERLRRILEQCQANALDMFSRSMRVDMGVDRKWELYDFETASRKTLYSEAMMRIPPARAYDQVPVCENCFEVYTLLNTRRDLIFDLTKKGGGLGWVGKKSAGGGATRQYKKSIGHSLGLGNRKGIEKLTVQEERASDARKKLLRRKEREIAEMERRVLAAEAKRRTSIWTSQRSVRAGDEEKKKRKVKKSKKKMTEEGAAARDVGPPNINPLPVPQPPQASNHALIITSGDIGEGKSSVCVSCACRVCGNVSDHALPPRRL